MSKPNDIEALKIEIAKMIAKAFEASGLSQTATGKKIGIKQQELSMILRGNVGGYSPQRLLDIARALGVDVGIKLIRPKPRSRPAEAARMSLRIG
jgi:transcriptional regulator with XRE-family HTH domain